MDTAARCAVAAEARRGARWRFALITVLALGVALGAPAAALAAAPAITAIAPNNGPQAGGALVRITGQGFVPGVTVSFGGVVAASVALDSPEAIAAVAPPGGGGELVQVSVADAEGASAAVARDQFAYDRAPASPWLGLVGNSISNPATNDWLGPVDLFASHHIAYDRTFELIAGQLPREAGPRGRDAPSLFEDGLRYDREYGMVPVTDIEYRGYPHDYTADPNFPQTRAAGEAGKDTIQGYVAGFIRTASATLNLIARRYPGMRVLFEPINEPWGYTTPKYDGAEYADVIAALLPRAAAAGIPLSDIYVGATGEDCGAECTADGWVPAMYAAQPALEGEIHGWYLHPYGPASGVAEDDSEGIESLPSVQATMTSGQDNIIVSEVGYCDDQLNRTLEDPPCEGGGEPVARATFELTRMLDVALRYRDEGWLRALIVYDRNAGGWAMQEYPGKALSPAGRELVAFARAYGQGLDMRSPPWEQALLAEA
jgi:hypothetical protein